MAIMHKNKQKKEQPYENRVDLKFLVVHITIVPSEQGPAVNRLLNSLNVPCQFTQRGRGTASKKVREILGLEDNKKEVIISLMSEDIVPKINTELEAFFAASDKNKGIAFTIPLQSIIGVRVYNFLADML